MPLPTLSVSDTSATSGNNTAIASFIVSLDRSHDSQITVDYATADNVAIAEQDYEANNGTLVFAPGETEKTIEVDILADNPLSRDEEFKLQLSNPSSNATISDNEGIGIIIDSTLKVDFPNETDKKLQLASYPPDLEKDPHNLPFEVDASHNSLSITGDGDGWKEIPLADNLASNDSRVNPYMVVEFKELLPISVAGVSVNESSDVATFTLTIPEAIKTEISLDYATADDTAKAGQDYTAKTGSVIFAVGETSKTIDVALNDDVKSEAAESFSLNLS